jgi:hypothetical protein
MECHLYAVYCWALVEFHCSVFSLFAVTHKNSGKEAEDQAMGLNQGPAVNSIQVALPEDGTMGCQNM